MKNYLASLLISVWALGLNLLISFENPKEYFFTLTAISMATIGCMWGAIKLLKSPQEEK